MGHIPLNVVNFARDGRRTVRIPVPSSGLNLREDWQSNDSSKGVMMKNLVCDNRGVKSRGSFEKISSSTDEILTFHNITSRPFCERTIIHAGTKILCFCNDDSSLTVLYEGVPDKDSMFCEFTSKLYLYCDTYVFSIDRNLVCVEEYPEAPLVVEDVNQGVGDSGDTVKGYDVNLIAPRVAVKYTPCSASKFALPYACDTSRKIRAFYGKTELEINISKTTSTTVYITKDVDNKAVTIEYYLANPEEIGYDSLFNGCTCCVGYGGSDVSGTRIFAGGNVQRPGEYCKSELINPLYFKKSDIQKLGDGCDIITGFAKMNDNLMIFTDRSLYRMSYELSDAGGFFSTCQISSNIGCDIPKRIQLVENKIVFANTELGVHMVCYTDRVREMNIVPLSGNVNGGKYGISGCDKEMLKKGTSLDFGGKYYFCADGKVYICDYGRCGFSSSSSYDNSQGKLVWYMWEGMENEVLFSMGDELYCVTSTDSTVKKYTDKAFCDESSFVTERYDFDSPFVKKTVKGIQLDVEMSKGAEMIVTIYGDGKPVYSQSIYSSGDGRMCIDINLPHISLYRLSYGLCMQNGFFELNSAAVKAVFN